MATHKEIDPRGFLLNDNDTGVDHLGESTFAGAIADSIHHVDTPITIGLFAKWGGGKSFLLRHIESILKRYEKQSIVDDKRKERYPDDGSKCINPTRAMLWTTFVLTLGAVIFGSVMLAVKPEAVVKAFGINAEMPKSPPVPDNETNAPTATAVDDAISLDPPDYLRTLKIIGMVLIPIEILFVFLIGCCGKSWLSLEYYGSCRLLTYGAFTKLPVRDSSNDIVEDPGQLPAQVLKHVRPGDERLAMAAAEAEIFPRRYIFVDFKAWEYAGSDTLWAGVITNITDAIEREFGVITARMFRMLKIEKIPQNISNTDARTIYVDLAGDPKMDDVLDMMKQYGVVTICRQVGPGKTRGRKSWEIVYSNDGECRSAKECLAIEGVDYSEKHPCRGEDTERKSKNSQSKGAKQKLLEYEMESLQGGEDSRSQDGLDDALDRVARPPNNSLCLRFCSHFAKYPTLLLCCPRLVWWILIFLCSILIPIIAYIIAEYLDLDVYRTYRIVPIFGQILLWLPAGIAATAFLVKFIWAMCHSQTKRINEALDGTRTNMADHLGFMNKVKTEIDVVTRLIQCARFTHQTDYKIVITIDDLDRVPLNKVQSVLEAVSILLSHKSSPFICFVAVDPRIVAKCIEEGMGEVLRKSKITGHEYLKKIINLPICLPEISDAGKKRFIAGLIDQADHTITYREIEEKSRVRPPVESWSTTAVDYAPSKAAVDYAKVPIKGRKFSGKMDRPRSWAAMTTDAVDGVQLTFQCANIPAPTKTSSLQIDKTPKTEPTIRELDHKKFLFHCRKVIYHDEQMHKHMQGNPRNIKRLFNVISLTACIINSFWKRQKRRNFILSHANDAAQPTFDDSNKIVRTKELAEDLVRWIVLADQWPYRTSYVLQVIEDADQRASAGLESERIPGDWTIFEIFQNKVKEECEKGDPSLLSLDADPDLFYSYINLLRQNDFTVRRIKKLERFTVNLDYSVRHCIAFERDLSCLSTTAKSDAENTKEVPTIQRDQKSTSKSPDIILEYKPEEIQALQNESDRRFSMPAVLVKA